MQFIYRGVHYKSTPATNGNAPTEAVLGKYRGAGLQIGQSAWTAQSEAVTVLRYRGNYKNTSRLNSI